MHIIRCILMDLNAYSFWLYSILYASIFIVFNVFCISSLTCSPIDLLMTSIELSEWNIICYQPGHPEITASPSANAFLEWRDFLGRRPMSPDLMCIVQNPHRLGTVCVSFPTLLSILQLLQCMQIPFYYVNVHIKYWLYMIILYYLILVVTSWRWFV